MNGPDLIKIEAARKAGFNSGRTLGYQEGLDERYIMNAKEKAEVEKALIAAREEGYESGYGAGYDEGYDCGWDAATE